MRLRIAWSYPALITLYDLPMHSAMLVDRAVIRFAETGEGDVERIPPYYRLRVGMYRVRFTVDLEAGTMNVLFLYRAR
jgi:mRNA-degrading endonuclease RelE of RelBE toxin-antitoxin system